MIKNAFPLPRLLRNSILPILFALLLALFACEGEKAGSLFDSDDTSQPAPVITAVDPPNSAFAGIGILTITGQNFSAVKENNFVFFDAEKGEVLEASTTQLVVKAPNLVKDNVNIKIAVFKVEQFSNTITYKLEAAVTELYPFGQFDVPYAIASDANDNLFVSLVSNNVGAGVKKIDPPGVLSDYAPRGGETFWVALKVAPDSALIGARNVRALFRIPPGGGAPATWVVLPQQSITLNTLDFDRDGNLWTAGNNAQIYRIAPDRSVMGFDFVGNVRALRIFDDHVYLGGVRDNAEKVWRLPIISADQVGAEEEVFDFGANYSGGRVLAIDFASDGDMYIGTGVAASIVVVHPNGSSEPLYPGLFQPRSVYFAWGPGNFLYVTRQSDVGVDQTVLQINMLKPGAPNYGRGDTDQANTLTSE